MTTQNESTEASNEFAESFLSRARALYDIARWRIEEQTTRIQTLDTRIVGIASLAALIVSIFSVALAFGFDDPPSGIWVFAVVVFGLFAASMLCGFKALMARDWTIGPELRRVQMRVAHDEAYQWLLSGNEIVGTYFANEEGIRTKEKWTRLQLILTAANATAVSISAVVYAVPWDRVSDLLCGC